MNPQKPSHFLVLCFLLIIFSLFNLSFSICNPNDKKVLLSIKSHFKNPASLVSWNPKTDCCGNWENLLCNQQGHVTLLRFEDVNDIRGPIPPFMHQLPFLRSLFFVNTPHISGPIPSSIGNLKNIGQLYIMKTNVSGPIPSSLGQLTGLKELYLVRNRLAGPIPESLGQLKVLLHLDLSFNQLTGPIPLTLSQLTNLQVLQLASNKLSGPIPEIVTRRLINLLTLNLESNLLSGPLPESIGQDITILTVASNQLSGHIPKSLGRTKIISMDLSHNKFIGAASFLFGKGNNETATIYVSQNLLKFDFSNVDLSPSLVAFNISHNMIYGSLPKRFGHMMPDFTDVSYNQLCGPIPGGQAFKKADPNNYAHNKCLCGGPLRACK